MIVVAVTQNSLNNSYSAKWLSYIAIHTQVELYKQLWLQMQTNDAKTCEPHPLILKSILPKSGGRPFWLKLGKGTTFPYLPDFYGSS